MDCNHIVSFVRDVFDMTIFNKCPEALPKYWMEHILSLMGKQAILPAGDFLAQAG